MKKIVVLTGAVKRNGKKRKQVLACLWRVV